MDEARKRILRAKAIGAESVLFSGGEPTIHRDLPEMARYCSELGLKVGLITNGRMLSYRPYLKALVGFGLEYVYCSLHGPKEVHDAMVASPGAFKQTLLALKLLNGIPSVQVTANAVVVQNNLSHLETILRILLPLNRIGVKFSAVEPKGSALEDEAIVPDPLVSADAVNRAIAGARRMGFPRERMGIDGFPHCLGMEFPTLQQDMYTDGIFAIQEVDEADFHAIDYGNMKKPPRCLGCRVSDTCRSTYTRTWERYSTKLLQPLTGGISNSFNYFPVDEKEAPQLSPERLLRVKKEQTIEWFATDTGDFNEEQIGTIRDSLGQLYQQVDDALLADDFASQFRKLVRVEGETPPLFEAVDDNLFLEADRGVESVLRESTGAVLDVGCGHTRYDRVLRPKIDSGAIQYTGVDPQPAPSVRSLVAETGSTLFEGGIEEMPLPRQAFDEVWVLRSHNHLADLWTAYTKIVRALKWGGRLLVVDNVAFGLVRSTGMQKAVKALGDLVPPEHLRNHTSDEALAFLSTFPLRLLEESPVTPEGANQWRLLFEKAWPSGELGLDTF